jgi:predicted acyltransferase (DUF342 family)
MSWKKYGGTNKLDKLNNISVNTIVTDKFTLKNFYVGDWDICGGLNVTNNANITKDLYVGGNIVGTGNITITGSMNVFDTNIIGDIFVANSAYIRENIFMDLSGGTLLHGENRKFGFNTLTPQATIDISGDLVRTIDIHTSTLSNKNVIARNVNSQGITVNVEPTRSYIDFYVDNSMNLTTENYNGRLLYEQGGNFTVDVSNIVKFKPRVIFSQDLNKTLLEDERMIIYSNPLAVVPYIPSIYNDNSFNTGTAAYMVAADNSSNVFFRMGTEEGRGMTLGGGYFLNNKIMGTIALIDPSNVKYPAMNIISGNLITNLKTSVAVNKYNVSTTSDGTNRYAMDINGPVKMIHQELIVANDVTFQVFSTDFSGNVGIAIGSPSKISAPFEQYFLKTVDGGYTWTSTRIVDTSGNPNPNTLETIAQNFYVAYIVKENDFLIAGDRRFFYRSINGGQNWSRISYFDGGSETSDPITATSLFLSSDPSNNRLIVGRDDGRITNSNQTWDTLNRIYIGFIPTGLTKVNAIHGNLLDSVIVGNGGLVPYRTFPNSVDINGNFVAGTLGTLVASGSIFYGVNVFSDGVNNHVVAVGSGIIYYTHNLKWNGSYTVTWSSVSISGTLRSVKILDISRAIAVGDSGIIMYSIDGFQTWNTMTQGMLDAMGNGSLLSGVNLSNINILNANDFVISGTVQAYDASFGILGRTKLFNFYAPYLLNRSNNHVLEASGNIVVSGDLQVNDAGQILTNTANFNILPNVAQEINIGSTVVGGNTNVKANLDVTLAITGHQNMLIYGDSSLNSRLFVGGDASLNSKLYVVGDASLNSRVFVGGDVSLNSMLFVGGDASLNSKLFVGGDVSLNSKLYVVGDASLNSKLLVVGDVSLNSRLFVGGDVSLNSKLYVVGDASLNSRVFVGGDVSLNNRLFVAGNTTMFDLSAQNVDLSGGLKVNTINSFSGSSLSIGGSTDTLYLGSASSRVEIFGNLFLPGSITSTTVNNLEVKNKTILLNDEETGSKVSAFCGLKYRDENNDNQGYFLTNGLMDGFLFKSTQNANRVNLDVSGLYLPNGLTQGFVLLKPNSYTDISADYTITTGLVNIVDIQNLDASLNRRVERDVGNTTAATQVINTNILAAGLYVNKPVDTYITDSQMDISGNAFISKLGLGTSSVNLNYTLDVNGNMRVSNNVDISGSFSVQTNINSFGNIIQW